MQRHHLYRRPARGLVLAGLEGGVIEKIVQVRRVLFGLTARIDGKRSRGAELPAGGDQFLQVFLARQSPLARLLAVVLHEAAGIDAVAGDIVKIRIPHGFRHAIDLVDEVAQHGRHPAAERAARDPVLRRLPERYLVCPRHRAHAVEGPFADAPRRRIHHPFEGDIRMALVHQPHVGQRVLDFGPLEEAQTRRRCDRGCQPSERLLRVRGTVHSTGTAPRLRPARRRAATRGCDPRRSAPRRLR